MADSATLPEQMHGLLGAAPAAAATRSPAIRAIISHDIAEVEAMWRAFEAAGVESPGQGFGFTKLWAETQGIAAADRFFITGEVDGVPVALLPLHRRRVRGIRQLGWFPGTHVGCNAPLVDRQRLAALTPAQRRALWQAMLPATLRADVVHLGAVPETIFNGIDLFAELGNSLTCETLYRAQFDSWELANTTQRNKSRRKHDRQQGDRLEALGAVTFAEISRGADAAPVLDVMFRQRAARFRDMGVFDPFADPRIRGFYDASVRPDSTVDVRLHVLRLDGEIVAVRYNVAQGEKLFCLISSMSDDPAIQTGSPGKQCLLRVMQTVFDNGVRVFDMGAGFTDEKRHWCNVQVPVRQHYVPLSPVGHAAVTLSRTWQASRRRIKENRTLLSLLKKCRGILVRAKSARPDPKPETGED